mmetsp:Transcript_5156/g.16218  ORF Transcript_5156/g.16218 Transcript_5156/m.16218 type:complete len:195 (+) Transcript_5156:38-622(+)
MDSSRKRRALWTGSPQERPRPLSSRESAELRDALREPEKEPSVAPASDDAPFYRVDVDPRRHTHESPVPPPADDDDDDVAGAEETKEEVPPVAVEEPARKQEPATLFGIRSDAARRVAPVTSSLSSWFLAGGPPTLGKPKQPEESREKKRRKQHERIIGAVQTELAQERESHRRLRDALVVAAEAPLPNGDAPL